MGHGTNHFRPTGLVAHRHCCCDSVHAQVLPITDLAQMSCACAELKCTPQVTLLRYWRAGCMHGGEGAQTQGARSSNDVRRLWWSSDATSILFQTLHNRAWQVCGCYLMALLHGRDENSVAVLL